MGVGARPLSSPMAKRPTKQSQPRTQLHTWAVYHIASKLKLVGLAHNQSDAKWTIRQAIEEYKVPSNQRDRLMAQRRD